MAVENPLEPPALLNLETAASIKLETTASVRSHLVQAQLILKIKELVRRRLLLIKISSSHLQDFKQAI